MFRANVSKYDVEIISDSSNTKTLSPRAQKLHRAKKNIFRKFVGFMMVMTIVAFTGLASLSAAPIAHADPIGDAMKDMFCATGYFNAEPEDRGIGPDTAQYLVNKENQVKTPDGKDVAITAYEKYGMAGMSWTVWSGPEQQSDLDGKGRFAGKQIVNLVGGEKNNAGIDKWADGTEPNAHPSFFNVNKNCGMPMEVGTTAVANFMMNGTSWIVHIANMTFQAAYESSSSVIDKLNPVIKDIITGLKDALYLEFLTPIVMLGALWLGYKGLVKKQSTEMATGALWMVGAAIVGFALIANPMFLSSVVNKTVSLVTEGTITSITTVSTASMAKNGSGAASNVCKVDDTGSSVATPGTGEQPKTASRNTVRMFQCNMWYSFMYTPWTIGQFGHPTSGAGYAKTDYINTDFGKLDKGTPKLQDFPQTIDFGTNKVNSNWALYMLDNRVNYPGSDRTAQGRAVVQVASYELYRSDPNNIWKGENAGNRLTTATLSFVSALGAGIMIVIISMSMIVLELGLVILTLLSPLFLLIGVHPGFGRRIALGWLETLVGLAIKRIILSMMLAIMIVFYSIILAASQSMDWLTAMIMVIAVSIGGITYKDQILRMFNNINLGGNGGLEAQRLPGYDRAKSAAGGSMRNLAAAAFGGGMVSRMQRGSDKGNGGAGNGGAGERKKTAIEMARKEREDAQNTSVNDGGAGERPNSSPVVGNSAGEHDSNDGGGAGPRPEIDGQGTLFPIPDTSHDNRLNNDIAREKARLDAKHQRINEQTGAPIMKPVGEAQARKSMIENAHAEAKRYNKRYDNLRPIRQSAAFIENKATEMRDRKESVKRSAVNVRNAASGKMDSAKDAIRNSAPVAGTRRAVNNTKQAASDYHSAAKSSIPLYNRGSSAVANKYSERKTVVAQRKAVKQEERAVQRRAKEIMKSSDFNDRAKEFAKEQRRQAKAVKRNSQNGGGATPAPRS